MYKKQNRKDISLKELGIKLFFFLFLKYIRSTILIKIFPSDAKWETWTS